MYFWHLSFGWVVSRVNVRCIYHSDVLRVNVHVKRNTYRFDPICTVVDNKPLFNTKSTYNTNIRDKRHALEIFIVKDALHLRWVATYHMLGDILTKRSVSPGLLLRVLDWGKFLIVEDESISRSSEKIKGNLWGCVIYDLLSLFSFHLITIGTYWSVADCVRFTSSPFWCAACGYTYLVVNIASCCR